MDAELELDSGLYHIQQLRNEYGKSLVEFGGPESLFDWRHMGGPIVRNTLVRRWAMRWTSRRSWQTV